MLPKIAFLLFLIPCSSLRGQISDSELEKLKTKWRVELQSKGAEFVSKMPRKEGMSDFSDSIQRLFVQDTFVVENLLQRQLEKDPSTLGMNKANLACASEYEVLQEHYFQILSAKMNEEDAELVNAWQKDWKTLVEKERVLAGKLMQEAYSGGGSIHSIEYTRRLMMQQKNHLLTLIDYLTHFI